MEIRIDADRNIAYIRLTGLLSREIILVAFDAAVADPEYRPGMGRLWDFRASDMSQLDASTVASMAKHASQYPPGINDVKVAFVAERALEFGMGRLFGAHAEDEKTPVAVFYDMEEAEAWITS